MPANTEGQFGQGSEKPDLVEGVPAHLRVVGLYDFQKSILTRTIA